MKIFITAVEDIGIQMNQKELTKTDDFKLKKPFGLQGFHKKIQRFKGW